MSAVPGFIDVVLIDDAPHFRHGVGAVLAQEGGIRVVGEAGDGDAALALVERLVPDVAMVDLRMPGMGGVELIAAIRRVSPVTRILVLTVSDDDDDLLTALVAGAHGYLLKDTSIEVVPAAARDVAAGGTPLAPAMAARLVERCGHVLHESESRVLRLMSEGVSPAEIGRRMALPADAVAAHVRNAMDRVHFNAWLAEKGLQQL